MKFTWTGNDHTLKKNESSNSILLEYFAFYFKNVFCNDIYKKYMYMYTI